MSTNLGDATHTAVTTSGGCPTCGFVADKVSPQDAIVALRSFPARWRAALAVHLDDPDPETVLTTRPSPSEWTALEHAGHVRDALHALDIRVQRTLREDEPVLPATHVTPPSGANEQGVAVVLAALTVGTDQFSQTVELVPPAQWSRQARRGGETVTALDLVREAVHLGSHHLREATATLHEVRAALI